MDPPPFAYDEVVMMNFAVMTRSRISTLSSVGLAVAGLIMFGGQQARAEQTPPLIIGQRVSPADLSRSLRSQSQKMLLSFQKGAPFGIARGKNGRSSWG